MLRASFVAAIVAFCGALASAKDAPANKSAAELRPVPVSALLEQLANSPLGKGDATMFRAVSALMEKEAAIANAPNYTPLPGGAKPTRLWFRLRNSPAADVVKSIQDLIDRDPNALPEPEFSEWKQAVLIAEPASNSILISASPRVAESVGKLLADLDARPPMVTFQVLIGELKASPTDGKSAHAAVAVAKVPSMQEDGAAWLAAAMKEERVKILQRPQLTTLDGQAANVMIGERVQWMPNGLVINKTIGANLSLTPSILRNGRIATKLDFEDSQIDPTAPATTIRKTGIQTTFTAKEGQTVIVRVSGEREMIVALTPHIYRQKAENSSANTSAKASAPPYAEAR